MYVQTISVSAAVFLFSDCAASAQQCSREQLETFMKQRILETILISTWSSTSGITPCVATRLKEKLQHIYASDQIFVEEP